MADNSIDFPSDDMSVGDKLDAKKFGLPIAKTIWNKNLTRGNSLFYNKRVAYREVDEWLFAKNYLTKRVNIALGKVLNRKYDLVIDNIDVNAIDAKEDLSARLQLLIDHKSWFDKMSKEAKIDTRPEGVDAGAVLPMNRNEIDLFMDLDYKTVEEIGMELGTKHHLRRNKWTARTGVLWVFKGCNRCLCWNG